MVVARGVTKSYRSGLHVMQVLNSIDLEIARGEFVALTGPSGCGKTTLLNCLSGLDLPDKGSIQVEGKEVSRMSDRARTRHRAMRMGFVFQTFNLVPVLTATQNVAVPLMLAGVRRSKAKKHALQRLEMVGLSQHARKRPHQLSGGQQQRVAIARALVNDPAVIWADEPTGNLDAENGTKILDLFLDLQRRKNVTLVVVTHADELARRADRVVALRDGKALSANAGA